MPKTSIVGINMDMPLLLYPLRSVIAGSAARTLQPSASSRRRSSEQLELSPDPLPSRCGSFAATVRLRQAGSRAIHMKSSTKSTDPKIDGATVTRDWLRRVYHSPADDMKQHLDFAAGARYAQTNLRLVRAVADAPAAAAGSGDRGDFSGALFAGR